MSNVQTAAEIAAMTPNECWYVYVGNQSVREFVDNSGDVTDYVSACPFCKGMDEDAREELASSLALHIARNS